MLLIEDPNGFNNTGFCISLNKYTMSYLKILYLLLTDVINLRNTVNKKNSISISWDNTIPNCEEKKHLFHVVSLSYYNGTHIMTNTYTTTTNHFTFEKLTKNTTYVIGVATAINSSIASLKEIVVTTAQSGETCYSVSITYKHLISVYLHLKLITVVCRSSLILQQIHSVFNKYQEFTILL